MDQHPCSSLQLAKDPAFNERVAACMWNQAQTYQNSLDAAIEALAMDTLRGTTMAQPSMVNMIASFPGVVEGATVMLGDGSEIVDQTAITDAAILGQVQSNWKTVADLFYTPPTPPTP